MEEFLEEELSDDRIISGETPRESSGGIFRRKKPLEQLTEHIEQLLEELLEELPEKILKRFLDKRPGNS